MKALQRLLFENAISIRTKLTGIPLLFICLLILSQLEGMYLKKQRDSHGVVSDQILQRSDLLAAIIPPQCHLLDQYALLRDLTTDGTGVHDAVATAAISALEKNGIVSYQKHLSNYDRQIDAGDMLLVPSRDLLRSMQKNYETFYRLYRTQVLPLIQKGDMEAAHTAILRELTPLYLNHRDMVARLQDATEKQQMRGQELLEIQMKQASHLESLVMIVEIIVMVLFLGIFLLYGSYLCGQLGTITQSLERLAAGDLRDADSGDE